MKLQIDDLGFVSINVEDWNINLPFPRLTLTTDYSTWITYVSRKDVPANTPITNIEYWKPICRLSKDLALNYEEFKRLVNNKLLEFSSIIVAQQKKIDDLYTQMQAFLTTSESGQAFSNELGDSEVMGVTQKSLTEFINGIYQMIADSSGIEIGDVQISITPDSFFKNDAAVVTVSALADYGLFDYVKVYFDGTEVLQKTSVQEFAEQLTISDTTTILVKVRILGREYEYQKTVTMASDFFIGAGNSYEDVYDPSKSIPYDGDPTGRYPVHIEQGQRIYIVLPTADVSKIEQIEINDFNLPMTTSEVGIYTVYESINTYIEDDCYIDINY